MIDEIETGKDLYLEEVIKKYHTLFDLIPCLITIHDRDYRIIEYNKEFKDKFDSEPGAFCYQAYKNRKSKCENCPVEKTFKDGKSHYSEEKGVNKDNRTTYWIAKTAPIKNSKGEIVAAVEMNLDITPSKNLEERLKQSEERYFSIFNNIPSPLFVLDYETLAIIDCNISATDVYHFTRDNLIGKSFLDFFNANEREEFLEKIRSRPYIGKVKQITKQCKNIYVDMWMSEYEYSEKNVLLVAAADITGRLETEQQLIQASKMSTLGVMASGVAHELNQPLSVIKTASGFLLKKLKKKESIGADILDELISKMDRNVDRASNIINHMRQFARKSDMELERVQPNDILKNTFDLFSQQLKVREIELVWDKEKELPEVIADPGQLEQVFINFLVNSRDAIEEKRNSLGLKEGCDTIRINTYSNEKNILIEISDTGMGVKEDISQKIFEPFFTTKESGKGTGLGLSISYRFIDEIGGNIKLRPSEDNEGAFFTISIPRADRVVKNQEGL